MNKNDLKDQVKILGIVFIVTIAFFLFIKYIRPFGLDGEAVRFWAKKWFFWPVGNLFSKTIANPALIIALVLTLVAERLRVTRGARSLVRPPQRRSERPFPVLGAHRVKASNKTLFVHRPVNGAACPRL